MAVTIVAGEPDDFDAALDIYVRSSMGRLGGERPLDHRVADVADSIRDPETWLFVAKDGGVPVAMALAMPGRESHRSGAVVPGLCYLYLIFVVPERWGEGIGGQLLDHVMADARARGFTRINLHTPDDNDRSRALYESRSFARTGGVIPRLSDPTQTTSEWARDI